MPFSCSRLATTVLYLLTLSAPALLAASPEPPASADSSTATVALIERGRYLVKITGCNDCHTPDYAATGGQVEEKNWLVGDRLGWRGPWGTTYPSNLRRYVQTLSEDQWVERMQTVPLRPPMPWYALRDMTPPDVRALYQFIKHLGSAGKPAPAFLPPGQTPTGPAVVFPAPPSEPAVDQRSPPPPAPLHDLPGPAAAPE